MLAVARRESALRIIEPAQINRLAASCNNGG